MKKLTIFTPSFNRINYLPRLYESLKKQTCKDFIWLIVDDGSTDGTQDLINRYIKMNEVEIEYYYILNSGKYLAHNLGVKLSKTELFMCVDSDDYLDKNAVESMFIFWDMNSDSDIVGIVAPKHLQNEQIACRFFPKTGIKTKFCCLNDQFRIKGETAILLKVDILQKHYIPKFEGEKFASEEIIYNQIDEKYWIKTLNQKVYYMEYLKDGITKNLFKTWLKNPNSTKYLLNSRYKTIYSLDKKSVYIKRIKTIIWLEALALKLKESIFLNISNKVAAVLLFPIAVFVAYKKF